MLDTQEPKNISTPISLEGTKRGKGQWSINNNFSLLLVSMSVSGFTCFFWLCYKASLLLEQHNGLSSPLSRYHPCFQMTKQGLHYAFKIRAPLSPHASEQNHKLSADCRCIHALCLTWGGWFQNNLQRKNSLLMWPFFILCVFGAASLWK